MEQQILKYDLLFHKINSNMKYIIEISNKERGIKSLRIISPYDSLNILMGITDMWELDMFIEWLEEEVINTDLADYSMQGAIIYQPILWGSNKSKIAEIEDGEFIAGQEFDTKEFLGICYAWRDFLAQTNRDDSLP
jgi:hypothetical protein